MKAILRVSLLVACAVAMVITPLASAGTMDDLSWFGNTGATSHPVKDVEYSGYWWWPTQAKSNSADGEKWGNRGIVYNMYAPPAPPAPAAPAPAPQRIAEAPKVERSIPVFNHVLFDFDKAVVKPQGVMEIKKVAAELGAHPGDTIVVEGHTCDLNGSGDPMYNKKLGQRRADAVVKVLADNGIKMSRITSVSKGSTMPAVANDSDSNRKLNRRVMLNFKIGS
jgi:outer membrane protein OmpA-like peptidoglycan-associated protein